MSNNSRVLADIEACVAQIAGALGKLEGCVRALQDDKPLLPPSSSSRIHRAEPPIIPQEIASVLSRASSRMGGGGGGGGDSSISRPSVSRTQPKFVDWASNLSGLSRASTGGGARAAPVEDDTDTY